MISTTIALGILFHSFLGAMGALRKMLHKKEENNNNGDDDNDADEPTSAAARRRWKMIFNVSKFESMVRTPQVPERIDESLFYNQNVKFPSRSRHRTLVGRFYCI